MTALDLRSASLYILKEAMAMRIATRNNRQLCTRGAVLEDK